MVVFGLVLIFYGPSWLLSLLLVPLIIAFLAYRVFLWSLTFFPSRILDALSFRIGGFWRTLPVNGWLTVQDGHLILKTYSNWTPYEPVRIDWKDSRTILLRTKSETMLLSFFKEEEASNTVRTIKEQFPSTVVSENVQKDRQSLMGGTLE
jgi:hypothetical protein